MKDNKNGANNILKVRDKLISTSNPLIMGIINTTPDSFYSESRFRSNDVVIEKVSSMIEQGVDIIDIGGFSTRPGATFVSEKEELERVLPIIHLLRNEFPNLVLSIDTFRSPVAKSAVEAGVDMINDVYGGRLDDTLFDTVASLDVPYVLMHSRGDAKTMQGLTNYQNTVDDIIYELSKSIHELRSKGVKDIIVDPGIGFAKTMEQNFEIIKRLEDFHVLNCPILLGVSRKSFIYNTINCTANDALNGTTAIHSFVQSKNVGIFRVHDVKEIREINLLYRSVLKK